MNGSPVRSKRPMPTNHWTATESGDGAFIEGKPYTKGMDSETPSLPERPSRFGSTTRFLKWATLTGVIVVLLAMVSLWIVNRELPKFIERALNENVKGYRFTVAQATLSPLLSLEIREMTMSQLDHPDPPIAAIPRWRLSIHWRHMLSGVLVSDYLISRPTFHISLPQAKQELQEEMPFHEKGWREAIYAFYPLQINEFKIDDAEVIYVDQHPAKPLRFTHLNFLAGNIRNIRSPNDSYPSDLGLEGNIFDSGRIQIKGHANFLAHPHIGIQADMVLQQVMLEPLLPVTERYHVQVRGGILSADGRLEYTAEGMTTATLNRLSIEDADVDYIHAPETAATEARVAHAAVKTAQQLDNKPETLIRIDHGVVKNSEFGFVNDAAKPPYRVFLSNGELRIENISNHLSQGSSIVTLTGQFMGTGDTVISGTFQPEKKSPDFDLHAKIEKTQMHAMNGLLRAYGNFDVTAGVFSLYSELKVKNGRVEGYIKPLFRDMKVYDARQDREKDLFGKLYEGLVGGVAKLLENTPREEVATRTDVAGPLKDPQTSTWQRSEERRVGKGGKSRV